jgi:hypothetical protein
MSVTVTETSSGNIEWLTRELDAVPIAVRKKMAAATGPAVLCSAQSPHNIIATNAFWRKLCGFGSEALGKSPSILQGELTDMKKAAKFRRDLTDDGLSRVMLANYKKSGEAFVHRLLATKVKGGHNGREYYFTESHEVTDESLRRAVLKPCAASAYTLVEQCVSVVIALSLTYLVIAYLSSLSGVPRTHGSNATASLGSSADLKASITCSLVAILVATIISAMEAVAEGRRTWRASKDNPIAAIAFVMTVGLLLVSLEAHPQAIAGAAVGILGAIRAVCFPSATVPRKWPRRMSSAQWSKGMAEVFMVTGVALGAVAGNLASSLAPADPPAQASFAPFAPWELIP